MKIKKISSRGFKPFISFTSETPIECVETLQTFLEEDMWYAINSGELKTRKKFNKYLNNHFNVCYDNMKTFYYGKKCKKHKKR